MRFSFECTRGRDRGRIFDVDREVVTIGRGEGSDFAVDPRESGVSGRHCELFVERGRLAVRDVGSTNGTFLDGSRLDAPRVLRDGDRIELGHDGPILEVRCVEEATVADAGLPAAPSRPAPPTTSAAGGGARSGVAMALSAVFPGAGQALNGQLIKGAFILGTCVLVLPWIWGVFDAGKISRRVTAQGGGAGLGGVFLHGWFAANLVLLVLIVLTVAGVLT